MIRTIQIDDSSSKAKALIDFLLTLEFVHAGDDAFTLTDEHVAILEERSQNHVSGKSASYSWEEVKALVRKAK